ncbi:MAG: peptidylprolyl isomerase [Thermococci archaeon]|nr:peptidylprolyl isomerase [Thermococci archaeon]
MVKIKKGDVVRIHYTGRVKGTNEVFDTTYEDVAKEAGIYSEKGIYGPVPVAVGGGHVLKGLDRRLEGLEVGGEYTIEVPPEEGFGRRDPKLIKVYSLGQFRRQGLRPYPGMEVKIRSGEKEAKGRVITVSGGRVRVDFNHPLAGKTLVYEVKVVEKIDDPIEKIKAMLELRLPSVDREKVIIDVGEKDVTLDFRPLLDSIDKNTLLLGELMLEGDLKFIGYEEITFKPNVQEILNPKPKEDEEEADEDVEGDEGRSEAADAGEAEKSVDTVEEGAEGKEEDGAEEHNDEKAATAEEEELRNEA